MNRFEKLMTTLGLIGAIATAIASLFAHFNKKPEVPKPADATEWRCQVEHKEDSWSMECR